MVNMLFENADFFNIWVTSSTVVVCLIIVVLSCVCGCKKKIPKNELLGLAGLVKITNPDENVNYNTPPNIQLNSVEILAEDDLKLDNHGLHKRGSNTIASATRSLPDLPVDSGDASEKLWSNNENNVDNGSDLYATVEDANRKKRALLSGLTAESSYTPSQTDDSLSPYARLKGEHSYDQLQQNEHPYAQVGSNNNGAVPSTSHEAAVSSTPSSGRGGGGGGGGDREDGGRSKSPSEEGGETGGGAVLGEEIPAASAIAGSVPANQDLPYMTPPIPQQHFSGDSQDSTKGYTSISVREPLARILGNTRRTDPHYATVSDDSDEMYAAIEEKYTSGSETYAQISPPPAAVPPSVLPLHRQQSADGRSLSSEDSPRRERRPANSPLPEPPLSSPLAPPSPHRVDDMYAKVVKKRSPEHSFPPTAVGEGSTSSSASSPSTPQPSISQQIQSPLAGYETLPDPNYEELKDHDYASLLRRGKCTETQSTSTSGQRRADSPGSPGGRSQPPPASPPLEAPLAGYETLSDPNYEELRDHDYASLQRRYEGVDPNYESVGSGGCDPPYERVEAPDYELVLRQGGVEVPQSILELYAQVNKSPEKQPSQT